MLFNGGCDEYERKDVDSLLLQKAVMEMRVCHVNYGSVINFDLSRDGE